MIITFHTKLIFHLGLFLAAYRQTAQLIKLNLSAVRGQRCVLISAQWLCAVLLTLSLTASSFLPWLPVANLFSMVSVTPLVMLVFPSSLERSPCAYDWWSLLDSRYRFDFLFSLFFQICPKYILFFFFLF